MLVSTCYKMQNALKMQDAKCKMQNEAVAPGVSALDQQEMQNAIKMQDAR